VRGVPSRFTFTRDADDDPVWSPDGTTIAFSSIRNGAPGIYQKPVGRDADDELVFTNHEPLHPSDWSPDGRVLLFEQTSPTSASDIWALPLDGERTPRLYLATRFSETDAHFSPDGKWVAYTSDEDGRDEVYIQSFPDAHEKVQISTRGGVSPRWARSGRELYFLSTERWLMAVTATLAKPFQVGTIKPLFDAPVGLGGNRYVPAHDGKRFLLNVGTAEGSAAHLVVVLNWAEHLATMQPPH
jgi:Tol biopolymer transport system component